MTNIPLPSVFSRRRWVRRVWSPLKINAMKALIRKVRGAPWKLAGGKVLTQQFSRDQTGWYADIPMWPGPRGACAMVAGADTLLDLLAGEDDCIRLALSFDRAELSHDAGVGQLDLLRPDAYGDGGDYVCTMPRHASFELWLCGVTEFVFGTMPSRIYFERV